VGGVGRTVPGDGGGGDVGFIRYPVGHDPVALRTRLRAVRPRLSECLGCKLKWPGVGSGRACAGRARNMPGAGAPAPPKRRSPEDAKTKTSPCPQGVAKANTSSPNSKTTAYGENDYLAGWGGQCN